MPLFSTYFCDVPYNLREAKSSSLLVRLCLHIAVNHNWAWVQTLCVLINYYWCARGNTASRRSRQMLIPISHLENKGDAMATLGNLANHFYCYIYWWDAGAYWQQFGNPSFYLQIGFLTLAFLLWQETFARAKTWVKELQRQASPNIVIALAGNKADLANKRMVDYEVSRVLSSPSMNLV